jgi:hypothetical protein
MGFGDVIALSIVVTSYIPAIVSSLFVDRPCDLVRLF